MTELLLASHPRPAKLSPAAVAAVQEMLAKGCVRLLAEEGWRPQRSLREGRPVAGPVWRRCEPSELGLSFSPAALDFLVWATSEKMGDNAAAWRWPADGALTSGDRFLLFCAYSALRNSETGDRWRRRRPFLDHGLCWLSYPDDYANAPAHGDLDLSPWIAGQGAIVLENWQHRLARQWVEVEHRKRRLQDASHVRALGSAQERVLRALLSAADRAGRWDLARFLLIGARGLLAAHDGAEERFAELAATETTAGKRIEFLRLSLAPIRALLALRQWQRRSETIGYFDQGYAAAQFWKFEWEHFDAERLCRSAESLVRRVVPWEASPALDLNRE